MHNPQMQHPLNYAVLEYLEVEIAAGIPEIMVELLDSYINDSHQTFDTLRNGFAIGDMKQVELYAHSLKSSSATFGAEMLASLFGELELLARDGEATSITSRLEEIEAKLKDVTVALEVERNRFAES